MTLAWQVGVKVASTTSRFSFCGCDECHKKINLGRKEFIRLSLGGHCASLREVGSEAEAETMAGFTPASSLSDRLSHIQLSCKAQDHLLRDGVTHSRVGPPT